MSSNFYRYDIYTNNGHMTTLFNQEAAEKIYSKYCDWKDRGYSKKVSLYGTDQSTRKEILLAQYE